jgi:hypothetical protein
MPAPPKIRTAELRRKGRKQKRFPFPLYITCIAGADSPDTAPKVVTHDTLTSEMPTHQPFEYLSAAMALTKANRK